MITDAMINEAKSAAFHYRGEETIISAVFDSDDSLHDLTFNWETAENYAQQGYRVVVTNDDGDYWNRDRIQSLCDAATAAYVDCFGE